MSRTVVDAVDLERRVKDMYTQVALDPHGQFHSNTLRGDTAPVPGARVVFHQPISISNMWGCSDGWRRTCPQALSRR